MFKRILKILGVIVLVLAALTLWMLWQGGFFRTVEPRFAGVCESLPLDGSAEDIVVDRERGYAYLSFKDRLGTMKGSPAATATLLRVDLNQYPYRAEPALTREIPDISPHGLSLWTDADGQRTLMVINHPKERGEGPEKVEILREESPGLYTPVETVTSPLFNSPNDLAAVGPRQFYVINDAVPGGGLKSGLQMMGLTGGSPLVYFDGTEARVVADDNMGGGGVNVSADGSTLYVAETFGQRIRVLDRNPADGSVTQRARIKVETSPDNIDVAADGSLTVAGHINTMALAAHFASGAPAPTQVLRIIPDNGGEPVVDEIYLNPGEAISAGSVGATWNDKLLLGSITSKQMLVCTEP
jgi:arylesterase/paraoxonase